MADQNRTGEGKHRRTAQDEIDPDKTQRTNAVQKVVDEYFVAWPTTDQDRRNA